VPITKAAQKHKRKTKAIQIHKNERPNRNKNSAAVEKNNIDKVVGQKP
jgi:hypothetical protein